LPTTHKMLFSILLLILTPYRRNYWGSSMRISTQLIIYSAFVKYLRKKMKYNEAVYQLFIDFKNLMIQLGWRSCIIF